jgi:NAD(P)-dependent dehydrogenase (short-subunit alcohol dehydrogenase family)
VLGARGSNRLKTLAARIADAGGEAAYAPKDVKRREDVTNLVKLACERYGKVDVLVNNAGIMPVSPLDAVFRKQVSGISSTPLLQQDTRLCRTSRSPSDGAGLTPICEARILTTLCHISAVPWSVGARTRTW